MPIPRSKYHDPTQAYPSTLHQEGAGISRGLDLPWDEPNPQLPPRKYSALPLSYTPAYAGLPHGLNPPLNPVVRKT